MKKSAKFGALALAALSTIALSGCSVTKKLDLIIEYSYTPEGTQTEVTKSISAQDILDRYISKEGSTAAKAYYDTIYEVALRETFTNGKFKQYASDVASEAEKAVADAKDAADDADMDWDDYLINNKSIGKEDDGLSESEREHLFYLDCELDAMKDRVSNEFYNQFSEWNASSDDNDQEDIDNYNMVYGENGYINTKLPYHVRDIIIKVDADADNYTTGEISQENAEDLYTLIDALTKTNTTTNTYADVAKRYTDDTSATETMGEYLMDLDTSFINEFKLGIYAYDAIFNSETNTNSLKDKFLMPENVLEDLTNIGIDYIPYEAIVLLNDYSDITKYKDPATGNELTVNEGLTRYYPRNIIFNKYFNSHNIGFITNKKVDSSDPTNEYILTDTGTTVLSDIDEDGNYKVSNDSYFAEGSSQATHFQKVEGLSEEVLCDEKGNPIIVVRSETSNAGIHFIVIEKSALENQETAEVKLNEYYAPVNPLELNGQDSSGNPYTNPDFPTDENGNQLKTYVNGNRTLSVSGYGERVDTLRDKYESYQSSKKDYLLFEWVTDGNFQAASETVQEKVEQYINSQILSADLTNEQSLIDSWNDYDTTLLEQESARQVGLIPETCAIHYGDSEYYGVGGLCYYTSSLNQND